MNAASLPEADVRRTVLIADHEDLFVKALGDELTADGYEVMTACTGEDVRQVAQRDTPAALLLGELSNPRARLALVDAVRAAKAPFDPSMAVIVFSSSASLGDVLRAFEHGADDVVPRSIEYPELRMRLRARVRGERSRRPPDVLRVGELVVDTRARCALVSGRPIALTHHEFVLLVCLAREPDRVFSKAQLLQRVWGYPAGTVSRTLDSHAARLRRKLAGDGEARWIRNVWGFGYALLPPGEAQGSTRVLRAA